MQAEIQHDVPAVVAANEVLREIVRTGRIVLATGEEVEATSHVNAACGALLQKAIKAIHAKVGLEVGLAFGVSTLYILEAFAETGAEKLIGMDPSQHDAYWRGAGLHNITRAGYGNLYEFHPETSQQVLPELVRDGQRIDFAFVDGWHTFDHVLIDFFYIDQMLRAGGIVVFDDVGYPSIRRTCDFIVTNRDYEIFDCVREDRLPAFSRRTRNKIKQLLLPLARTDKSPGPEARRTESLIDDVYFLALRKRSDDRRRWDHFVQF